MVLSKREASPLFCLQEGRARGWEYDIYLLLLVFWFFFKIYYMNQFLMCL